MKTNYMQIYIFYEKNKKRDKHSKCLNMLKLKHNIQLLVYEHYQEKKVRIVIRTSKSPFVETKNL